MRGLQRGAASFGSSTASAALELSNRLVQAIQVRAAAGNQGVGGTRWCPHAKALSTHFGPSHTPCPAHTAASPTRCGFFLGIASCHSPQ